MHRTGLAATTAAVIVGLGVAGCGSTSKSSSRTATTASITKAAFLAKGNAICRANNARTKAVGGSLGNNPTRAQIVRVVETQFVPSIQSAIDGIRALGAPAGDQAKVTGMMDLAQADLNKIKRDPTLIAAGPGTFHNFASEAHAYGLTECASNK
jgi:hypothetical protein